MGTWGDHIELHAFANAMNVEVVVVESGGSTDVTIISPDNPNIETQQIVVGNIGQMHYVATEAADEEESCIQLNEKVTEKEDSANLSLDKWKTAIWSEGAIKWLCSSLLLSYRRYTNEPV